MTICMRYVSYRRNISYTEILRKNANVFILVKKQV